MAVLKCKICGGSLDFEKGESIATCQYCGTKQTIPQYHNEQQIQKYNKINELRQNNDYEEALKLCEDTMETDTKDAETYWNLVLCKYGIEYVEDPATHKHIPTINRMQFDSILKDKDYLTALNIADEEQKELYETQAKEIYEIQKGTLEIIKKEKPFDVFICYKESDEDGKRTQDSVIANDLYHALTKEGFKVFFARITLEDKLGSEYEPYIFSALNSAKVMIVLGTKPEYFNAVWVKNEWSRFLSLAKEESNKALIPAYKDFDPYLLPKEFSSLQAQDMGKLAFIQDLVYGIKKILSAAKKKALPIFFKKNAKWLTAVGLALVLIVAGVFLFAQKGDPTNGEKDTSDSNATSSEQQDSESQGNETSTTTSGNQTQTSSKNEGSTTNSASGNTTTNNSTTNGNSQSSNTNNTTANSTTNSESGSGEELDKNENSDIPQYTYTNKEAEIIINDYGDTGFVVEGCLKGGLHCINVPKMPIVLSAERNEDYGGTVKLQINDIKIENNYIVFTGKNLSDEGDRSLQALQLYADIYEDGFFSLTEYGHYTKFNNDGSFKAKIFLRSMDAGDFSMHIYIFDIFMV